MAYRRYRGLPFVLRNSKPPTPPAQGTPALRVFRVTGSGGV